jgi:predicted DNA-binding transcriptional regulator AlpA
MPTKRKISEPEAAAYLTAPQVCQRYGGVSHMWLQRVLDSDPTFPRPAKFGHKKNSWRFFKISELVEWERAQAARA